MNLKDKQLVIRYWKEGSEESLRIADAVYAKRYYDHALFCGHLALEKLLKAMVIEAANEPAPRTHDLVYLSGLARVDITPEQQQFLATVNDYNIEGRYPEEKLEFHRRATKQLVQKELKRIHDFYLWLSRYSVKS